MLVAAWSADGPSTLACVLEANPWWRGDGHRSGPDERLVLTLGGVRSSNVALDWRPTGVEDLLVRSEDPHLWDYGTHAAIFGNSPLPDPQRFFLDLWDVVHFRLGAGGAVTLPFEHLPFREWAARVSGNRTYHLIGGPLPLVEACRPLLDAQGVEYVLLPGPERPTGHLRVVWVGTSWVVCERATVELPDAAD